MTSAVMRAVRTMLIGLVAAACSARPTPPATTEQLASLRVTHPSDWTSVAGPGQVHGGALVPLFYLTNQALTVTCPEPSSGAVFEGCPSPISALSAGGVLITVSPAGGLSEPVPPDIAVIDPTDEWTGPCRSIGGERQVQSVLEGVVVSACLRGPNLDTEEAAVRAMIASLQRT